MDDFEAGANREMYFWGGLTIIICSILHYLFRNRLNFGGSDYEAKIQETKSETQTAVETSSESAVTESRSGKSKKRPQWKGKTEFSHPWLLKNLKGHPGNVLLMDFSANGKFMAATCDESNAAVDPASSAERRRKRERRRPPASPLLSSLQRISREELVADLRPHLLSSKQMWALGYPLEIEPNSSKAVVYIHPLPRPRLTQLKFLDVNAPEFVPSSSQSDSGRGSLGSSRSESDEEADAVEHLCVRCDKMFRMTRESEYIVDETCVYHWGRLTGDCRHTCCNGPLGSKGCSTSRFHVWSGTKPGMNGPLDGYVKAKTPRGGVFAIDTEMCYTTAGLELASVAVISVDGRLVYKSLVKPSSQVVDHNTRFSGIRPRDLARATKTLRDVQNDILGFVGSDTVLVGHALDNDLRALKLLHNVVVDTCAMYPHSRGFPLRRSLRSLAEELLGRSVQRSSTGHSPVEDARAAMDLVMLKVNQARQQQKRITKRLPFLEPYDPLISSA